MWDQEEIYGDAHYKRFLVMSGDGNYKPIVGAYKNKTGVGQDSQALFSARVGDSFSLLNTAFSTPDKNNYSQHCKEVPKYRCNKALRETAGWFKNDTVNLMSNIFGTDTKNKHSKYPWTAMAWKSFRGTQYSLKKLVVSVRPNKDEMNGMSVQQLCDSCKLC